jgi:predicted TIM-barrel fold metal-dependent hydrolase
VDKSEVLRQNRIYVACQTDDDLPYVLKYAGEDHLVIGTDYGHNDTSSEILALRKLKADGTVSPAVVNKILDDNARALYGL